MPLKVYVDTGDSVWSTNGLTFDSLEKAMAYGNDLWSRWMAVRKFAVVEVPESFGEMHLTPEQITKMRAEDRGPAEPKRDRPAQGLPTQGEKRTETSNSKKVSKQRLRT